MMQQRAVLIPEIRAQRGCSRSLFIFGIVVLSLALALVLPELVSSFRFFGLSAYPLVISSMTLGVVLLLALLIFFFSRWSRMQRLLTQAGQPTMIVSNHPLRIGESFTLDCTIPPQQGTEIIAGTVTLVMRESASYETGMGTQRTTTTVTHDFTFGAVLKIPHIAATGGLPYTARWMMAIPREAMHTFRGGNNTIRWHVLYEVSIGIGAKKRTYRQSYELTVSPMVLEV